MLRQNCKDRCKVWRGRCCIDETKDQQCSVFVSSNLTCVPNSHIQDILVSDYHGLLQMNLHGYWRIEYLVIPQFHLELAI